MAQLTTKQLGRFKTNPRVRKTFVEAKLSLLGESHRHEQLQPVLAQPNGSIIAGERRYWAGKLAEHAEEAAKTESEDFLRILRTNRKQVTEYT